jgi:hypothetical protein
MKACGFLAAAVFLFSASLQAQEGSVRANKITDEPHHVLLLQNSEVRAFHLNLQPNEVTIPHQHEKFYAYLSMRPVTIGNEVRGRQPVLTQLEPGELHTSRGGFTVAERNNSSEPAEVLVIEAIKAEHGSFDTPMLGFRYHNAAFSGLFESPVMRGYSMMFFPGGQVDSHAENYDRLLIAVTDLKLRDTLADGTQSNLEMKAGEIHWLSRGGAHAVTNLMDSIGRLITLEFN